MSINAANQKAVQKIITSDIYLIGIEENASVLTNFKKNMLLHAGPPFKDGWNSISGPVRGAMIGALLYEGLALDEAEATELLAGGAIDFEPCHHFQAVGPMAGVISYSMPLFVVKNITTGDKAYTTMNEGLGKVLRFGAYDQEVIDHLHWMKNFLAPILKDVLAYTGPIHLSKLINNALQMGDECHNRNRAGTSLLLRQLVPGLLSIDYNLDLIKEVYNFINSNDHFFLNLAMAAAKATMDTIIGFKESTLISAMARNGTEFGIRVAGLGSQWFTAQAEVIKGLFFPGYSQKDANRDLGDSVIAETMGIGGFAMAAALPIVQFVGGTAEDAINYTRQMYEITVAENPTYQIPMLDFRGAPTGIDIREVLQTNILPIINTGIAHKESGIGQIGAGLVTPPLKCFIDAAHAFAKAYNR